MNGRHDGRPYGRRIFFFISEAESKYKIRSDFSISPKHKFDIGHFFCSHWFKSNILHWIIMQIKPLMLIILIGLIKKVA